MADRMTWAEFVEAVEGELAKWEISRDTEIYFIEVWQPHKWLSVTTVEDGGLHIE